MQIHTFRQHSSESFAQRPRWGIGQWLYRNRKTIFKATMRVAVYSTILMAAYNVITGGWSVYMFLENYVFPIFQEVM
jgi:hypothetical protein